MTTNIFQARWFNISFLMFILIQPFLDLLTSLSLRLTGSDFTLGILIRLSFIFIGGLYLLLNKDNPYRKGQFIYLSILFVFLVINFTISYLNKPSFLLVVEIKYILKVLYIIVSLFIYSVVLRTLQKQFWIEKTVLYIVASMTVLGLVMVVSSLTGTAFESYEGGKMGHVGWFYAGNEMGAIVSIGFPLVLMAALKKSNLFWIPVLLCIYTLLSIGTKVGYGTILIVLSVGLVFYSIDFIRNKKLSTKYSMKNIYILLAIIVGVIIYTPYSPVAHNMNMHMSWLGVGNSGENGENPEDELEENDVTDEQVDSLIYSGRDQYLETYQNYFKAAPSSQKLFGMGYAGNYKKEAKMIEMDFHDIFYSFGYIGMIIFLLPIGFYIYKIAKLTLSRLKIHLNFENILIVLGIALGLAISFVAGHVLTAPGVSIYLALLISYLTSKLETN